MKPPSDLGRFGEDTVAVHLTDNGIGIIARNYRTPVGEIDIIGWDADCLCFFEVKTRRTSTPDYPIELSISRRKLGRLRTTATRFMMELAGRYVTCRFVGVLVTVDERGRAEINSFDL